MIQVFSSWALTLIEQWHRLRPVALSFCLLTLVVLGTACKSLVTVSDSSIPKLLTPLAQARVDDLLKQLVPFTRLESLRASQTYLQFTDAQASERFRYEADSILVLQRPDNIRLLIQAPGIKTKIADMTSQSNHFRVAVFVPSEYRRFLLGTNDADYSMWRAKLKEKERNSALAEARPFHFTEAVMIRPLNLNDSHFAYALEEALLEGPDTRPGSKKGARVLRSFYVISEIALPSTAQQTALVRRRFWFDRNNDARFARQQIFDSQGALATEVTYSNFKKLNSDSQDLWPGVVLVSRPHEGYSARLTFTEERFEINPQLPPNAFVLENNEGLPETNLDKDKPAAP